MKREWWKSEEVDGLQPRAEGYVRISISPGVADRFHATPEIIAADLDEADRRRRRGGKDDVEVPAVEEVRRAGLDPGGPGEGLGDSRRSHRSVLRDEG